MNARREGDENPNSIVVTETMKLLADSSYGYQIMHRSRHTVTKYLTDEKAHGAINNKMFKRLGHINDQLYEVEFVKSESKHKEPLIGGFFILQYANLRMLEQYFNFFDKYCDVTNFEELEMDTDWLYIALSEHVGLYVRLYPTSNEKRLELFSKSRLRGCIFSQLNNKFVPSYLLR